jgi:hypothetical protein
MGGSSKILGGVELRFQRRLNTHPLPAVKSYQNRRFDKTGIALSEFS